MNRPMRRPASPPYPLCLVATWDPLVPKETIPVVTAELMKSNVLRLRQHFGQTSVSDVAKSRHRNQRRVPVVTCRNPFVMPDTSTVPATAQWPKRNVRPNPRPDSSRFGRTGAKVSVSVPRVMVATQTRHAIAHRRHALVERNPVWATPDIGWMFV